MKKEKEEGSWKLGEGGSDGDLVRKKQSKKKLEIRRSRRRK